MAVLKNRAKMSTSATGTGSPITLGSAEDGYQSFADAGVANADVVRYVIEDGSNFEIGTGTYTSSGTTLSRTVSESSNSNNAINLSGSATVFIGATAEDIPETNLFAESYDGSSTKPSASGSQNAVSIGVGANSSGHDTISIGENSSAVSTKALALGYSAYAGGGGQNTAIGPNSFTGTSAYSSAFGHNAYSTGQDGVAIGQARSTGTDSLAAVISTNSSSYGASGANSIAIGQFAKATASQAFTVNGYAQGTRSIAIGASSHATSTDGCAIGYDTTAVGSALALGTQANAQAGYSVAIHRGKAEQRGKIAFSGGIFATQGDAQGGQFVLLADTTDATATVLTSNNGSASTDNQIVAASDTCITFDGTITAMQNGAQAYASWKIEGLLVNDGGTTTLANSATTVIQNSSGWGMALSADNTNNALAITCTGEASHNIRWVANIRTTECTFA